MLGFACICKNLKKEGSFRATTIKSLSKLDKDTRLKKLRSIAVDNLYTTLKILKWCVKNNILMYRFSSSLIPLATYYNDWAWWEDENILKQCKNIKNLVNEYNIRVSMHPDQFCVINSDKSNVVYNSILILEYHNKLSNLLGNNLLILHVGSTVGGKSYSIERFKNTFYQLDLDIRNKLTLENDDKSFTAIEVLRLCENLNIPMVLDLHHYRCNNDGEDLSLLRNRIISTWQNQKPKLHLSSGKDHSTDRRHSDYINLDDYSYALKYALDDFDIMLECKEKDNALFALL